MVTDSLKWSCFLKAILGMLSFSDLLCSTLTLKIESTYFILLANIVDIVLK